MHHSRLYKPRQFSHRLKLTPLSCHVSRRGGISPKELTDQRYTTPTTTKNRGSWSSKGRIHVTRPTIAAYTPRCKRRKKDGDTIERTIRVREFETWTCLGPVLVPRNRAGEREGGGRWGERDGSVAARNGGRGKERDRNEEELTRWPRGGVHCERDGVLGTEYRESSSQLLGGRC